MFAMRSVCTRYAPLAAMLAAAMSMAFSFCHLMELPARIGWPPELWVGSTVVGGQYMMFGTLGAFIEIAAIVGIMAWWYVQRRQTGAARLVAGVLYLLALALWWAIVFPANREFAGWLDGDIPADWAEWRTRWEYGHAAMAVLKIIGLAALFQSILPKDAANA